jgi:hypothetical protein
LKSLHDRNIGHEIHEFVGDIAAFEDARGTRPITWAKSTKKVEKRREKNTMGYQVHLNRE